MSPWTGEHLVSIHSVDEILQKPHHLDELRDPTLKPYAYD